MAKKTIYYKSFHKLLKDEFQKRKNNNSSYSMRAFAKGLEISPSTLSDFLNNKKEPSKQMKLKLGKILDLKKDEIKPYITLASQTEYESHLYEELAPSNENDNADFRNFLSNVYHFAIIQLLHLDDFKPDTIWIAKKLGLTIEEVDDIIMRLQKLHILVINENGKWKSQAPEYISNISEKGNLEVNKALQKQALIQALDALENLTYKDIDQTTMTFPINKDKLPFIKEKICRFRRELAAEFTNNEDELNSIYQFSFSVFPLTKEEE